MHFDLVVIGAGIHGATVAQAGAAAGYQTLVLEQYERPAQATSSRSSKLIHGGLRYLETGQFRLVRECLRERGYLLSNAPHLVHLVPFHIPIYRDTRRRPWNIGLGLSLYYLLGGKGFRCIPRTAWSQLDGLRTEGLQVVFRYQDAQTDDARLTRSVLASARSLGAEIQYGCRFLAADCEDRYCTLVYQQGSTSHTLRSRVLVNAGGPWVNDLLRRIRPRPEVLPIDLIQGTHLVLQGHLQQGMYYVEAPQDGRAVFVMPWRGNILLGTTETPYDGDPAQVQPQQAEVDYLLEVYRHYFNARIGAPQIINRFAGLRVLPQGFSTAFQRPRDTMLHIDRQRAPRVLSIYGGKLTSHRATAAQVLAKLKPLLPARTDRVDTRILPLPEVD